VTAIVAADARRLALLRGARGQVAIPDAFGGVGA
jgi:hypothetical protein